MLIKLWHIYPSGLLCCLIGRVKPVLFLEKSHLAEDFLFLSSSFSSFYPSPALDTEVQIPPPLCCSKSWEQQNLDVCIKLLDKVRSASRVSLGKSGTLLTGIMGAIWLVLVWFEWTVNLTPLRPKSLVYLCLFMICGWPIKLRHYYVLISCWNSIIYLKKQVITQGGCKSV